MDSRILNENELQQLDDQIELAVPKTLLGQALLDSSVVNGLLAYELNCGYGIDFDENDPRFGHVHQKNSQDALHFLIDWIYQYCQPDSATSSLSVDGFSYIPLLETADQYSLLWDLLSHLRRGWSSAIREVDEVRITPNPAPLPGAEMGDRLLFSPDPPDLLPNPDFDLDQLLTEAGARVIENTRLVIGGRRYYGRFSYSLTKALVRRHVAERECLIEHLWKYDPDIDVGTYTIGDFRQFWRYLGAVASLHRHLCHLSSRIGVVDEALEDLIMIKSRNDWASEIANYSELPIQKVYAMLDDLTFQRTTEKQGQKRTDVTLQPFLPISQDRLCLSTWLVFHANGESNLWSMKLNQNIDNFSRHTDAKEANWLEQLDQFLSSVGCEVLKFNVPKGEGDIDALFLDKADKFAIAVQLKTQQPPDRLNEVAREIRELSKGISQVEKAVNWLDSNPQLARKRIQHVAFDELTVKGMVLTPNTTGGGRIFNPKIPIAAERLLRWVVGPPGNRDLRKFWEIASEPVRYLPKSGIHYYDEPVEVEFAGLKFIFEDGGASLGKPWNPSVDIQFD